MVDAISQGERIYIDTDKAKPILKTGLNSEDEGIRENAERARENPFECWALQFFRYLVEYESAMNKTTQPLLLSLKPRYCGLDF